MNMELAPAAMKNKCARSKIQRDRRRFLITDIGTSVPANRATGGRSVALRPGRAMYW
jgi:hypothetical protein